jgi:hypothetical protein
MRGRRMRPVTSTSTRVRCVRSSRTVTPPGTRATPSLYACPRSAPSRRISRLLALLIAGVGSAALAMVFGAARVMQLGRLARRRRD